MRVYNQYGRRDNKYKARIKILVKAIGAEDFARQVEEEWTDIKDGPSTLTDEEFDRVAAYFAPPPYETLDDGGAELARQQEENKAFANWLNRNVKPHKRAGLRHRAAVAQEDRRAAGRRRPPTRWTSWPTWPTATASASCA